MTTLPPLLHRAPRLLYAAAILFFLASLALNYWELRLSMAFVEPDNPMIRLAMLKLIYQAALESLYIAAAGVIAHILLAIWQDATLRRDRGGDS